MFIDNMPVYCDMSLLVYLANLSFIVFKMRNHFVEFDKDVGGRSLLFSETNDNNSSSSFVMF